MATGMVHDKLSKTAFVRLRQDLSLCSDREPLRFLAGLVKPKWPMGAVSLSKKTPWDC